MPRFALALQRDGLEVDPPDQDQVPVQRLDLVHLSAQGG